MTEPIRVLQVFHCMDCGGAENMIMNLYRNIDRSRVQFDFLVHTRKKCYFDSEIKSLGGRIFHVPYFNILNTLTYKAYLDNFFKKHPEIRIVHGHVGSCSHIYLKTAKKHGCFAIAHSHSTRPTDISLKNILYRIFTMMTRRTADHFFACGEEAGIYRFGKEIASSGRFTVLNNAIDVRRYIFDPGTRDAVRESFGIADRFVAGHVGSFGYPKNHGFLLDIFESLLKKEPRAVLMLVGDGALRPEIERRVREKGISGKVIFTGVRNDVPELLQAMDCFVFPSHFEGLGIAAVEAQAAGLPAVCSGAVPQEAKLTELVRFVQLSESPDTWADAILSQSSCCERSDTSDDIISAGYDIRETAKWLAEFYLSHIPNQ